MSSGTLGRAAAGCSARDAYNAAREQVLSLCEVHEEYAAAALAHLAAGAQLFSEWNLGGRSVVIARKKHQADVERGGLEILDAIRIRRAPPAKAPPPPRSRIYTIQRRMLARLNERLQPRRREVVRAPKREDGPTPRQWRVSLLVLAWILRRLGNATAADRPATAPICTGRRCLT